MTAPLSSAAPPAAPDLRAAAAGATRGRRGRRIVRELLGWAAILLLALLIWPSNWGGLTGLTIVNGHSMDPTFGSGDLVVSVKQSSYAVGDIISYEIPVGEFGAGHRVVHRIFAIDETTGSPRYLTKGDNNLDIDEWRPAVSNVLGRVILRLPGFGNLLSPTWLPYEAGALAGILVTILIWPRRKQQEDSPAP